ncbi:DNA polymerase III subunit chi [Candidatus Nitrosacidococcus tergens]|uniref:DNA polymerase III chi subunit HolC n=1 Tax=Candidatus Nitrosacidococcus tergens TaxID=553981 RepID=A0A7G1Q995_9GAMM|nr:DNA polymerase III subunit chi [Candidatus Nitrosacidococcus tergens]CAB1275579.1 DNA polymerase III chi subunit HolC [Candidatus Nitrosacidococcus tergens]
MRQVDFYLLSSNKLREDERFACKLAEKVYNLGQKVYIYTESEDQVRAVDSLLWTFRQSSFVPHSVITDHNGEIPISPVLIGYQDKPNIPIDLLINLSSQIPSFYKDSQRIAEIILQDELKRQEGRKRYRYYRSESYELVAHEIKV